MSGLEENRDILLEIIEEIKEEADEVKEENKTSDYEQGQLLAYVTALGIIKTCLAGYDLKEYGLDFDIDKKYLLG